MTKATDSAVSTGSVASGRAVRELGIPGLTISPGDHICAFYRGRRERDEILIPFLRAGLRAGDKCICVVDQTDPQDLLAELGNPAEVDRWVNVNQLDVRCSADTYLRTGRFSGPAMLQVWEGLVGPALGDKRFSFARIVGEMTWALRQHDCIDELLGYESELNRFVPRYPQVILCLYDLEQFSGDIVVNLLKTHPRVLLGLMVLDNPYYLEPDEFLASRADATPEPATAAQLVSALTGGGATGRTGVTVDSLAGGAEA